MRSGRYIQQPTGYKAFIPSPLPPNPPLVLDAEMVRLLSKADRKLGQLNGLASIISDPDLFVYLYVRKEALISSQIEGTQCSLEDVLTGDTTSTGKSLDIEEVSNYVAAMNRGLDQLKKVPVSTRLLNEIHLVLMKNVRGSNKNPGEYRRSQNWIGNPGATLQNAEFIPPPSHEINRCMAELEKYIHGDDTLPPLIRAAMIHAQFETIHPYLDGNGRLGRLLITFLLQSWDVIEKPLLYLSYFFKANRTEYYERLMKTRLDGDWEGWVKFFLRGVSQSAEIANSAAIEIHQLHQKDLKKIEDSKPTSMMMPIFRQICLYPVQTIRSLEIRIGGCSRPTIQRAVNKLLKLEILTEPGNQKRNKRYAYGKYLDILTRDTTERPG